MLKLQLCAVSFLIAPDGVCAIEPVYSGDHFESHLEPWLELSSKS